MDQAALLLKIQETDLAILRGRKRLDEMPEKTAILEMRKRIRDLENLLARTQDAYQTIDRAVTLHEDEAASIGAKLEVEQTKLMSGAVTNPKEVQAISRELDSLTRHKDKVEVTAMAEMEKREQAAAQRDKVGAAVAQAKAKEADLVEQYKTNGGRIQVEIQRLEAQRTAIASKMDADLLARYEALRESKHGIGVGMLEGDICSICRVDLPADKVEALRAGPAIGMCSACHRLLVVEPGSDGA